MQSKQVKDLPFVPVTYQEEVFVQMLIRLDALCNMMSSLIDYIGQKENIPTEDVTEKVEVVKKKTTKKK